MVTRDASDRHPTSWWTLAAATIGLVAATSCGDSTADADGEIPGIGDAYVTAISAVLPDITTSEGEPLPVLYFWEFTDEPMSLDDQFVVIDYFDDTHDVRFVDQFDAAVDLDEPTTPPRDDGLLVGLGPIPVEPPHDVRIEIYENAESISAVIVTLATRNDTWTVIDEAPAVPEAFDVVT